MSVRGSTLLLDAKPQYKSFPRIQIFTPKLCPFEIRVHEYKYFFSELQCKTAALLYRATSWITTRPIMVLDSNICVITHHNKIIRIVSVMIHISTQLSKRTGAITPAFGSKLLKSDSILWVGYPIS